MNMVSSREIKINVVMMIEKLTTENTVQEERMERHIMKKHLNSRCKGR